MTRVVSLFTGVAGLDLAVEHVTGGRVAAHAEVDPTACKILAHHYPDTPNLGDATAIDWQPWVGRVDAVCAGFSCQDISQAGRGAGIADAAAVPAGVMECGCDWGDHDADTCDAASPTGLVPARLTDDGWDDLAAQAVTELNERDRSDPSGPPPERTIEGTRSGITWGATIRAVRALRPRHVYLENVGAILVRGLDVVAADLAAAGYDFRWACVRASDVGAPHRRDRWFAVAYPEGEQVGGAGLARPHSGRAVADAGRDGEQRRGRLGQLVRPPRGTEGEARQRQRVRDAARDRRTPPPDTNRPPRGRHAARSGPGALPRPQEHERAPVEPRRRGRGSRPREPVAWGEFEPAIRRWEHILGRPAPPPTDPRGRLNPDFVEWMVGLPQGWTDIDGVTRTGRLRCLGNIAVPQQAAAAYTMLLQ